MKAWGKTNEMTFVRTLVVLASLLLWGCHDDAPEPTLTPSLDSEGLPLECGDDGACGVGTVCDPATRRCVGCLSDAQCGTGSCHPVDRVCVQCVADGDCARGVCHPSRSVCVGCFDDAQCDGVCHREQLVCVQCMADGDCANGRCNAATSTCVGPCSTDVECGDGNACTNESCQDGVCVYGSREGESCDDGVSCTVADRCVGRGCVGERTEACCEPLTCREGEPVDTDDDLCLDRCACEGGELVAPGESCPCPAAAACPEGASATDSDADGCDDSCVCADGSVPTPAGCATCLDNCRAEPFDPSAYYIDAEQDGCYDRREVCPEGTRADTSPGAGCPDRCVGCELLVCPARSMAVDTNGDQCADACVCSDGRAAPVGGCACEVLFGCPVGEAAVDRTGDGCPDECAVTCRTACDCGADKESLAATCCDGCRVASACLDGFCASGCEAVQLNCAAVPRTDIDAVCGCDGTTYSSGCDADRADVDVASEATCELASCETNADCNAGETCEREVGRCDGGPMASKGICVEAPTSCLTAIAPVCGCDGQSYNNDCERRRAGVGLGAVGTCIGSSPRDF